MDDKLKKISLFAFYIIRQRLVNAIRQNQFCIINPGCADGYFSFRNVWLIFYFRFDIVQIAKAVWVVTIIRTALLNAFHQ